MDPDGQSLILAAVLFLLSLLSARALGAFSEIDGEEDDDAALLGAPRGFRITVRNLKVAAGAGFLVALTGDIMTMPGLPKVPTACSIDIDENGTITGLF